MFDQNQKLHLQDISVSDISNLDMEAEYISLPSQGFFYKGKYKNITLFKVKKLSYIEEDLLTTQSYYDNGTLFDEILKSVIVDKGFPINDLLEIDKITILWWLYIGAFGRDYESTHTCSNCGKETKISWDLGSFSTPEYPEIYLKDIIANGCVEVVVDSNKFQLIPSSYSRLLLIDEFLCTKNKTTGKSYNITKKLLGSIISITDDKGTVCDDVESIYHWLMHNTLSLKDSRYIQGCIKEIELAIDTTKDVKCKHCEQEDKTSFPMSIYFFRIDVIKYREYLIKSINFLHFWGKLDYNSCLRMPTHKRKTWNTLTSENLEILYPKSKK